MDNATFFPYVLVMAGVTYLIRMLPLAAIRGKIKSRFLQSFLAYVPYAVLGAMTIPAVFTSTASVPASLCGMALGLVLAWFGKGLLTVAVFSCIAAYAASLLIH